MLLVTITPRARACVRVRVSLLLVKQQQHHRTSPPALRTSPDELMHERAKNKMLQEEMEATLHDIQNM